jgi:hypothetical protein
MTFQHYQIRLDRNSFPVKPGPKRKLSDSARKRNKKAANAKLNKSRIYIGDILDGNKDCFLSGNEL